MTDQELAQKVSDRINAAEAVATGKRLIELQKAHRMLDKAWAILMPEMDFAPLSGGQKPPEVP